MARAVRRAVVLGLALCLSVGAGVAVAAPDAGGRDIQSFAVAEFEYQIDDCVRAYPSVAFIAGENAQYPLGSGKPFSWSDVTARLHIVDTCSGESLQHYEGWLPVPPTMETFEWATVAAEVFAIPGWNDESVDVAIDLSWTGYGAETVSVRRSDEWFRAERSVNAVLEGSVSFSPSTYLPAGLTVTPENAFEARLGWAAEIDTLARPACVAAPAGLTSWWSGDGTAADRVGGFDAVARAGAGYGRGLVRSAFSLDGVNDFFEVADADGVDVGGADFTASAWVRFDTVDGEQVILEKWFQAWEPDVASEGWTLTKLDNQSIRLAVSAADGFEVDADTDADLIEPDRWYLVTARRSGGQIAVFVDGLPRAGADLGGVSGWDLSNDLSLVFGRRAGEGQDFFLDGTIDEAQLYVGTAVSDADLWAQWAAGPAGLCRS